jgi:zinc D-Ala-D-Ala carboxypeptidase
MSWNDIKYFKAKEFDSPDLAGSGKNMNMDFILKLDKLRETFGAPLHINSGFRTPEHNAKVGGVNNSAHVQGKAADITCTNSSDRFKLIEHAIRMGFTRIGIAKTFIHLDTASDLPQKVIWFY